mmetsp:Transcript_67392/g.213325  ORF Transcript_67392/g.213325 Transcript_67392/m.213325 type:complete len:87 (+) Transcript_67392:497-757(+)|eukprot:CAMPEP_0182863344 /NCGR_PEP_ID=MMETSP0034_2-20130328/6588_1 /TAXON_ID=156128 /ORGANISM="Nephroselmis pyriformis, Strain CCMP717" /LENGTH=86 /DNA_ID=CAMNT_0024995539 /DNA_START=1604 /DNA_END=1864 /DNA_ORIENTATION=-
MEGYRRMKAMQIGLGRQRKAAGEESFMVVGSSSVRSPDGIKFFGASKTGAMRAEDWFPRLATGRVSAWAWVFSARSANVGFAWSAG